MANGTKILSENDIEEMISLYGVDAVKGYIRCSVHLLYKNKQTQKKQELYQFLMNKLDELENLELSGLKY